MSSTPALEVSGLRVCLRSGDAIVEEADVRLDPGDILGLVGESGSGKTTTALALLGYTAAGVEISAGTLEINGNRLRMDESMRASRGSLISYVPQNPGRALNPSLRIADAIDDLLRTHRRDRRSPGVAFQCSTLSVLTLRRSSPGVTRTSSQEVSSSACASRSRWRASRQCSCLMSRRPAWTSSPRPGS